MFKLRYGYLLSGLIIGCILLVSSISLFRDGKLHIFFVRSVRETRRISECPTGGIFWLTAGRMIVCSPAWAVIWSFGTGK
jgi:hypothetical protein